MKARGINDILVIFLSLSIVLLSMIILRGSTNVFAAIFNQFGSNAIPATNTFSGVLTDKNGDPMPNVTIMC